MALRLCSSLQMRLSGKGALFAGRSCGAVTGFFSQTAAASQLASHTGHSLFTPEHQAIRESVRKIIDTEINPYVEQWEEAEQFPAHHVFKILGQAGILGVSKPTDHLIFPDQPWEPHHGPLSQLSFDHLMLQSGYSEYGGMGLDFSYSIAVAEELGHIRCGGIPMAIGVQSDMATPALARFGSDELKRQFLAPTIAGDLVACLGVSEAGAGSDVASIKTNAVKKGDDYVINGSKMWITNGCQADWMCLLANTNTGPSHKNKSLICLPMKTPGVQITKKIKKIGMKSSDTAQIFFEDVRVPSKYLIGEEGMGFMYQMLQFQEERMWGVANVLTPMENVIEETIKYTRDRKIFNQPVLNNQVVHFRLAELATEVELLRSLLHRTVGMYIEGNDVTKFASMAKLKAGRLVREVSDSCLQFWGGMGFTDEVLVSRFYRDSRLLSIGAGADEVMLSIICKFMGTLPSKK